MSFNSALFSANGTGVSLVWSDWTVEADFDISGKFNLSYTYTTSIAIPDLGWSIKGSWGGASVGVYFDPTVALAANVDLALKLPVTADFHSGSVGVGTGVYDPSRFNGTALLHPTVAVGAPSLTSATTASAGVELKLAVGAQVSVVGIPVVNEVSLGADLFAAARVEALLLTGSTVSAACAAKNSPVEIDGKYGYEVGVEYSIPIVSLNGKYDFWGQPGYPYDIGYYCF
ncbi:hypothetical protein DFJ73DRAFT_809980 [Zopfochytrium polystomum]|nr:hypothetical protein DFJ73DRAFT_809980 [Zopfochytrium polystomum]